MTKIIAVLNQKGGVGKTTTVINLGAYLAKDGRHVLLVDNDPQGNATSGVGVDKSQADLTVYDLLLSDEANPAKAVVETGTAGMDLLPANTELAGAEVQLVTVPKRELQLKRVLSGFEHDIVLIDCPPSLSLLTVNALAAADSVLIPVQAEYYAMEGLSQLLSVVQTVKQGLNPDLGILGLLLTMYDKRTSLSDQVHAELKNHFGELVFKTVIPRNVRLAEAPSHGRPISDHDKWSKGARAYKLLAKEFEKRLHI